MRVSVYGCGYVGCVTAACLAREGHIVIGVDVDPFKVKCINDGNAPFFEPGLSELVKEMVAAKRLRATCDHAEAVAETDIGLVCVGTPAKRDGSAQLDFLLDVLSSIGAELKKKEDYFVVTLRSTVLPSIIEDELIPVLERSSGKTTGHGLGIAYNPEFLREGLALKDFYEAPWTIIGSSDSRAADTVASLYSALSVPVIRTSIPTASLLKYICNSFHALKVAFGNEVGRFCRELGADGAEVMDIFARDTKLNISSRYLKPGFAFGGSCLPKDLKAIMSECGKRSISLPLLTSIMNSNDVHLNSCIEMVAASDKKRVGIIGLSFKAGTDDLRESPAVELAERLIGKGRDVRIYEPSIGPGKLHGSNLRFIEKSIPHIWKVLVDNMSELINFAEIIVVTQDLSESHMGSLRRMSEDRICVDLTGKIQPRDVPGEYWSMDKPVLRPVLL